MGAGEEHERDTRHIVLFKVTGEPELENRNEPGFAYE